MKKVKLKKALDVFGEGEVISVDEASAKALVDRGDAVAVEDDEPADPDERDPLLRRSGDRPSHIGVTQVVEADPGPVAAGRDAVDDAPKVSDLKDDLVAQGVAVGLDEAEARALNKSELVAAIEAKIAEQGASSPAE